MDITKVLIPFEMVFDTDLGLLKFISENIYDEKIYRNDSFKSIRTIINLCINRPYRNPLYNFMRDKNTSNMDRLYVALVEQYEKEIVKNSILSALYPASLMMDEMDNISVYISCRDNIQKNHVLGLKEYTCTPIINPSPKDYDAIYIKYYQDFFNNNYKLEGKALYIANYAFNYEKIKDEVVLLEAPTLVYQTANKIQTLSIHNMDNN